MCPQHLKSSLPPGANGGRWSNGRASSSTKHQVWKPYKPKQQMEQQEQQPPPKPKEMPKRTSPDEIPVPSMEVETTGPLDFGPPADLCINEGSFPPHLLQQTASLVSTAATARENAPQMPQAQFCLPPAAPEEGKCVPEKEGIWPPLSGASRSGKKHKGGTSKQQRQPQQHLKPSTGAAQHPIGEDPIAGDSAVLVGSPAPCRAPPSSPASAVAADAGGAVDAATPTKPVASTAAGGVRAPPGLSGPDVQSALLRASFLGRTDIVRLCLERGASPAAADAIGRTPLHYAAATGVAEAVALLLKYAKNVQQPEAETNKTVALVDLADKKRWTPLLIAVTKEHVPCVKLLLAAGANAQHLLCHRCAPCRGGSTAAASAEGAPTADGSGEETSARGPAADAAAKEHGEAEKGEVCSNTPSTNNGEAPLQTWSAAIHFAAIKGSIPISELLLQHGSTGEASLLRSSSGAWMSRHRRISRDIDVFSSLMHHCRYQKD